MESIPPMNEEFSCSKKVTKVPIRSSNTKQNRISEFEVFQRLLQQFYRKMPICFLEFSCQIEKLGRLGRQDFLKFGISHTG